MCIAILSVGVCVGLGAWNLWTTARDTSQKTFNYKESENIFFSETSGRCYLTTRESCSIESAAKHNPTSRIRFIYTCNNLKELIKDKVFQIIYRMRNVEAVQLNVLQDFSEFPLAKWYQSEDFEKTRNKPVGLSDGLRYTLIRKFGGTTIDTDCVSRKPLPSLSAFAGFQSGSVVNGAVIRAQKESPFIIECTERFVSEYSPTTWGHNGPRLLTQLFKEACKRETKRYSTNTKCYNVYLFPPAAFYPVHFADRNLFFDPNATSLVLNLWKDSYMVHIWNKLVHRKEFKSGDGSPMDHLYKENCPATYSYIVDRGPVN
ncbi:lactosylceramide 4-alpha-galactosyltransferase-like [Limulus polyphemus]|uniref:Lactosylceramide 4-alpha-galactosyltransferase-like n=1 Tax=Limulus polyphemus TaxID=6850 RepID=A0ABM1BV03_LIMPO|nr:lactosylceramide 4-alpha-galactosyltransferase-like [Limulus polyphemus]